MTFVPQMCLAESWGHNHFRCFHQSPSVLPWLVGTPPMTKAVNTKSLLIYANGSKASQLSCWLDCQLDIFGRESVVVVLRRLRWRSLRCVAVWLCVCVCVFCVGFGVCLLSLSLCVCQCVCGVSVGGVCGVSEVSSSALSGSLLCVLLCEGRFGGGKTVTARFRVKYFPLR